MLSCAKVKFFVPRKELTDLKNSKLKYFDHNWAKPSIFSIVDYQDISFHDQPRLELNHILNFHCSPTNLDSFLKAFQPVTN